MREPAAPYVANAILTVVGVIYNYLGYKKYSFKPADVRERTDRA